MGKGENNKISSPVEKACYVIVETQKTISMDTIFYHQPPISRNNWLICENASS